MSSNFFFKKNKLKLNNIFPNNKIRNNFIVNDIRPLSNEKKK